MKKYLIRAAVLLLLFALCFAWLQGILHYRWAGNEDLYTRNVRYSQASGDSIDVLCLGTSELYAAYNPMAAYESAGVTGCNFAITFRCAMTVYYQLLYALEYQTPDVVICDFVCLFDDMLPSQQEGIYRKVVECMPDKALKEQMIREICAVDSTQSYLSWKLPLLRYHTMWSELTAENFQPDRRVDSSYPAYRKGAMFNESQFSGPPETITPELWDHEESIETFSDFSVGYYDKIIDLCKNRGITVVAVTPPKINDAAFYAANSEKLRAYFESREIPYLNYCTYDQVQRLGLTFAEHYYDRSHLNVDGSIVFSQALVRDLSELVPLEDHRADPAYAAEWTDILPEYRQYLEDLAARRAQN